MNPTEMIRALAGAVVIVLLVRWTFLYVKAGAGGWQTHGNPKKAQMIKQVCLEFLIFAVPFFTLAYFDLL